MERDPIEALGVDELGRFFIKPATLTFPYIYREGMEVQWDEGGAYLHGPIPPRAHLQSQVWWLRQILAAATQQGCVLDLTPKTTWQNVPEDLKQAIKNV